MLLYLFHIKVKLERNVTVDRSFWYKCFSSCTLFSHIKQKCDHLVKNVHNKFILGNSWVEIKITVKFIPLIHSEPPNIWALRTFLTKCHCCFFCWEIALNLWSWKSKCTCISLPKLNINFDYNTERQFLSWKTVFRVTAHIWEIFSAKTNLWE